ncbi:SMI1/KNR4 family protein [Myxococcus sp. CA056]|uniref:SMI1/KNR4 family protein n=1 Tax=Myxococcus sp. CA056 TaxID=2741740 RepID=UPI00157A6005|nr:SMI1/KNR4 family protein [Myxococcus sp. CA056]NTX16009.1 SMI1/KNR4 family protein [Myxococcus sp. CA056]
MPPLPPSLAAHLASLFQPSPPTSEQLEHFERGLPHPLPADYRELLTLHNGLELGRCATGTTDALGDEVHLGTLFAIRAEGRERLEPGGEHLPPDVMAFARHWGSINLFGIQLGDRPDSPAGTIWFFDSNADTDTADLFVARVHAPSFSAFLERLTPVPEAPAPSEPEAASEEAPPWNYPEAPDQVPPDAPSPEKPLVLGGHGHAMASAVLDVRIDTWAQDVESSQYRYLPERSTARYILEMEPPHSTVEDGQPAPVAGDVPVLHANGGRHPTLDEWSSLIVGPEGDWEAWYGNDAPALVHNRLTVLSRTGAELKVRWEARYADHGRERAFLFEGPVQLGSIHLYVETPEDIDRALEAALGIRLLPEEWTRQLHPRQDRGSWHDVLPVTLTLVSPVR